MTRGMILPLAVILVLAGMVGLYLGIMSAPPSEGEILEFHAARYVAETGGERTDCYGVPSGVAGVRLIVVCEREGSAAWYVAVDAAGQAVEDVLADEGAGT